MSQPNMIKQVQALKESLRKGEITLPQFEELLDLALHSQPICPDCGHQHIEGPECEVLLFDGMQFSTTCTCVKHDSKEDRGERKNDKSKHK